MATKNLSNEFMAKVLEDAAWKELSGDFAWNEQLLEKYKDKVVWKDISDNRNIIWTVSMIENSKTKLTGTNCRVQTTGISLRRRILRNTRITGTGVNCRETQILSCLPHFWNSSPSIGTGARL